MFKILKKMESGPVFENTSTELSPGICEAIPGDDLLLKVAYFMNSILTKLPSPCSSISVGDIGGTIQLTGKWSDLTLVYQVVEEWLREERNSSEGSAGHDAVNQLQKEVGAKVTSADLTIKPPVTRKRGRPPKEKVSELLVSPHTPDTKKIKREIDEGSADEVTPTKSQPLTSRIEIKTPHADIKQDATENPEELDVEREEGEIIFDKDETFASDQQIDDSLNEVNELSAPTKLEPIEENVEEKEVTYTTLEDGNFSCDECKYTTAKLRYVKEHISRNHSVKRFKCSECSQLFGSRKAFIEHYSYVHEQHKFKCDLCDKTFPKNYLLKSHKEQHTKSPKNKGDEPEEFQCPECDYTTKKLPHLETHKLRIHGEKNLECPHCDKKYSLHRDLKTHLKTHTETFECNICDKKLKSKTALDSHVKVIHEGKANDRAQKNYLCVTCGKLCKNKTLYTIHMNKFHLDNKPFACSTCDMKFYAKINLKQHEMTHSDKREFQCPVCEKSFKQRQGLRIHMVIHNETRPYKCDECNKSFTQLGALVRHKRIHSGDKPYHCQFCDAKFSDYSILRRHLLGIHKFDDPNLVRKMIAQSRAEAKERKPTSNEDTENVNKNDIVQAEPPEATLPEATLEPTVSLQNNTIQELTMPVFMMPTDNALHTPEKSALPLEEGTPQVYEVSTPQILPTPGVEEQVPLDLGETVVTQILPQTNQLFLNSTGLPGTVFIQQSDLTDPGTVVPTSLGHTEQVFVMNQEDKDPNLEPKDTMIITQDTLPANLTMLEHDGQTYAFVLESALPPTQ